MVTRAKTAADATRDAHNRFRLECARMGKPTWLVRTGGGRLVPCVRCNDQAEAAAAVRATTGSVGWVKDRVGYLVYSSG
jgi:hypothetical protein